MFTALSRGIPSFGDLAAKQPVAFATDVAATWTFPAPTLAPVGGPAIGQTLTKNGNGALSAEPPMLGTVLSVGDRLLVTADNPGIWVVTALGSGASPWVLTRATDCDTAAELVTGATTITSDFALDGGLFGGAQVIFGYDGATWNILPGAAAALDVIGQLLVNSLGASDPAADVNGRLVADTLNAQGPIYGDRLAMDDANRDVWLRRPAAKTLTLDADGAGATLTKVDARVTQLALPSTGYISGAKGPIRTVYTANDTWNKPTGIHHIEVEVQGGGGAGGGSAATTAGNSSLGSGGGGGGYARKLLTAADLAGDSTYTVTVGAAKAGTSGGAGGNGNPSSFAGTGITTVQGNGGTGGGTLANGSGRGGVQGGAGGTASGGDIHRIGGDGGAAWRNSADGFPIGDVGHGGESMLGGGASGVVSSGNGAAGSNYGGGGTGGYRAGAGTAQTGGTGAQGCVIVTEYYAP